MHEPRRLAIAVFSGATSTIENSPPLITSDQAREREALPPRPGDPRFDVLRPQRLAAPVTVYIEAYTAHPLERDGEGLYAAPDGYVDPKGNFSPHRQGHDDVPVYEAVLSPDDGLYLLPYMARQASGAAWEGSGIEAKGDVHMHRQTYFPDAARLFEEIDRFGIDDRGNNNLLSRNADFTFFRAAPSGGYTRGIAAGDRTHDGSDDIASEKRGVDFFYYSPRHAPEEPAMPTLARVTNVVQSALDSHTFDGAIWLEGSPALEETMYWLNLLIDTAVPLCGNAAQRPHGAVSSDGPRNIIDSISYIGSRIWSDGEGRDAIGTVVVQDEVIFTARDVQKSDARPGGYVATGGHGGIVGTVGVPGEPALTFRPVKRHTHNSAVNLRRLPVQVAGVRNDGSGRVVSCVVDVTDGEGRLLESAIPKVVFCKYGRYGMNDHTDDPQGEVEISARISENARRFPLAGFVLEGSQPFGLSYESMMAALERAVFAGMPVVRVGRGNAEGMVPPAVDGVFVAGSNLTATKARLLLMACLLRFGAPPPAMDPLDPTEEERAATRAHLASFDEVFETH